MSNRNFSQSTYDAVDKPGIAVVARYLQEKGHFVNYVGEDFGVDIKTRRDSRPNMCFEVEVRTIWTDEFRFPTIHVPERKHKIWDANPDAEVWFVTVNADFTKAFFYPAELVKECHLCEVHCDNPNSDFKGDENFWDVPVNDPRVRKIRF